MDQIQFVGAEMPVLVPAPPPPPVVPTFFESDFPIFYLLEDVQQETDVIDPFGLLGLYHYRFPAIQAADIANPKIVRPSIQVLDAGSQVVAPSTQAGDVNTATDSQQVGPITVIDELLDSIR